MENTDKKDKGLMILLNEVVKKKGMKYVLTYLNVAKGTVSRWYQNKRVPKQYDFDIMKMAGVDIDYSLYSSKEKDQFYTLPKTAAWCYGVFCDKLMELGVEEKKYIYVEPSAGSGNFLSVFPVDRRIGLDIEPKIDEVKEQDYFEWEPVEEGRYVVFGNPPFGLRGHMALKFINHSQKFAEFVCFILPQLFSSDGRGSPRKRVKGYNLIHSEKLMTNFLEPDDNEIKINTIFQIWSRDYKSEDYKLKDNKKNDVVQVYSLSDGGTPSTTRNKKMLYKCDRYLPSTCFGKENMRFHCKFDDLPRKKGYGVVFLRNRDNMIEKFDNIDWSEVAFLSTNSAYNIRTSQILKQFL
jgi:hypothetical protein